MMKGIRQHDVKDCGAACLATILRHYKSFVSMVKIREFMHVDKNGASMFALCQTAEHFGMSAEGFEGTLEEMRRGCLDGELTPPFIVHTIVDGNMQHYVVVEKINKSYVYVFDPGKGNHKFKIGEFEKIFTGFFITLIPKDDFIPERKNFESYSKFLDIILKQKRLFLTAIFFSVILACFSIFSSFAYQTMVDKYILNNDQAMDLRNIPVVSDIYVHIEQLCQSLPELFMAILFIYLAQNLIFALRGIIITNIYKNSSEMLISNYCRALTRLHMPFFHDRETGEILSRYNDIEELQSIISGIGLSILMDVVMAVAGGIVLFVISPDLFKIVIIMTVVYALIAFFYRKPIRSVSRSIMESDSQLLSKMKETVDGIESIKTSCSEDYADANLQSKVKKYVKVMKKGTLISLSQSTIMGLSQSLGSIAILYLGCVFILNGTISLGTFISFETLIYFFISPIQNLLSMQLTLQQAFVAADRLNDVLENRTEDEVFTGEKVYSTSDKTHLEVVDLKFAYGYREPVLNGISFSVEKAQKIAIVGKSGCGKTTLLHILGFLESEYEGKILLNGEDIREIDKTSYRENVIYVPQESTIFADSFRANILMGKKAEEKELFKIIEGCQLRDVIAAHGAGLEAVLEENGKNLSDGQKQRIAIARALIRNPKILLLDESTSHLDMETEEKIFNFISREFAQTMCLFSTHRESVIQRCDGSIRIEDGRIIISC